MFKHYLDELRLQTIKCSGLKTVVSLICFSRFLIMRILAFTFLGDFRICLSKCIAYRTFMAKITDISYLAEDKQIEALVSHLLREYVHCISSLITSIKM
jgi:hypothetical protein